MAMEALKPAEVINAQRRQGRQGKGHATAARTRPIAVRASGSSCRIPTFMLDASLVLRDEPLRRQRRQAALGRILLPDRRGDRLCLPETSRTVFP